MVQRYDNVQITKCTAWSIAKEAFHGLTDKGGYPYLDHLYRVANDIQIYAGKWPHDHLINAALIHDIVEDLEDNGWTIAKVSQIFGDRVGRIVDCLTKRAGESYDDYLERVKLNPDAVKIKIADLKDNLSIWRLHRKLSVKDVANIKKYNNAFLYLMDHRYDHLIE